MTITSEICEPVEDAQWLRIMAREFGGNAYRVNGKLVISSDMADYMSEKFNAIAGNLDAMQNKMQ
jgi:hypothetical protein